jgi:O-antigen/teichoic acid export membrane protein
VLIAVCLESARPESLVLSNVIVAGALLLPALVLMFQACPGEMHTPDAPLLWQMVKYSVPLGLATMLGTMTLQLSSVIVSSMCTPEQFAVYSTGAVEIPLVGIVTGSITTVILADMARLCHEGRRGEALQLFQTAALRSAAILLPAMVFFWIAAEPFIVALYSPKYHDSVLPFRLYLLALPVRTVTYGAALMALGKTRLVLIRSAIELMLNALLCIIMVRVLGYLGGVIALLLTLYTWSSAYNLHAISDGFSVRFRTVLPFAKLTQIAGIAIISGVPAWAVMMLVRAPEIQKLLLLAVVYWPLALYFLKKHGDLVVPARVGLLLCKVRALLPGSVPA